MLGLSFTVVSVWALIEFVSLVLADGYNRALGPQVDSKLCVTNSLCSRLIPLAVSILATQVAKVFSLKVSVGSTTWKLEMFEQARLLNGA
jgi:hypothetical protein